MSEDNPTTEFAAVSDGKGEAFQPAPLKIRWSASGEALVIALVYAVVLGCLMTYHMMWRDELQAWAIVSQSPTLADLWSNLRFEGHPGLWHLLLWVLFKCGAPFSAMAVLHLAIGTAIVCIFGRFAPFPFWQRLVFGLGYFPLYEYGVISRNYSLSFLLLFALCPYLAGTSAQRAERSWKEPLIAGALIFLLFQVSAFGAVIALTAAITIAFDYVWSSRNVRRVLPLSQLMVPMALTAAGLALFYIQIIRRTGDNGLLAPAPDIYNRLSTAFAGLPRALFPNPHFDSNPWYNIWNTTWIENVAVPADGNLVMVPALFAIVFLITVIGLLRTPRALVFFLAGTAGMFLFCVGFVMSDSMRYIGTGFFIWIAALWLARWESGEVKDEAGIEVAEKKNNETNMPPAGEEGASSGRSLSALAVQAWEHLHSGWVLHWLLGLSLAASCFASIQFISAEARVPFSQSLRISAWLENSPQPLPKIVVYPEYFGTPIAVRRGKPFYSLARGADAVFSIWKPENIWMPHPVTYERLLKIVMDSAPQPVIYISNDIVPQPPDTPQLKPFGYFGPSISSESYVVYILRKGSGSFMESASPHDGF